MQYIIDCIRDGRAVRDCHCRSISSPRRGTSKPIATSEFRHILPQARQPCQGVSCTTAAGSTKSKTFAVAAAMARRWTIWNWKKNVVSRSPVLCVAHDANPPTKEDWRLLFRVLRVVARRIVHTNPSFVSATDAGCPGLTDTTVGECYICPESREERLCADLESTPAPGNNGSIDDFP